MIEQVGPLRHAVAAQELQAGRVHRHAEGQSIVIGARRQRQAGIDSQLVGKRRQGRERAGPAHDDAMLGLADLAQGIGIARRGRVAHGLVDGRLHQRMGEREIATAQELLVRDHPLGAGLVAVGPPFVGPAGKAGEGDVHIVGRAAHQAGGIFRHLTQRPATAREILARARDHVADGDRLARLRIRHQADAGVLVLQVVDLGQRLGGAAEAGMLHDIDNALAVDPDLACAAKSLQEFLACPCRHPVPPLCWGKTLTPPAWSQQAAAASPPWRTRLRAWDGRDATARWHSGNRDSPARRRW